MISKEQIQDYLNWKAYNRRTKINSTKKKQNFCLGLQKFLLGGLIGIFLSCSSDYNMTKIILIAILAFLILLNMFIVVRYDSILKKLNIELNTIQDNLSLYNKGRWVGISIDHEYGFFNIYQPNSKS